MKLSTVLMTFALVALAIVPADYTVFSPYSFPDLPGFLGGVSDLSLNRVSPQV